jgi:hypothetical protein
MVFSFDPSIIGQGYGYTPEQVRMLLPAEIALQFAARPPITHHPATACFHAVFPNMHGKKETCMATCMFGDTPSGQIGNSNMS